MSYLILGLGTLLSLGGAWVIIASYGIIQVERGWAGVIAGTMALSCGIVTIALALILHRLSGLYAFLQTSQGRLTQSPQEFAAEEVEDEDDLQPFGLEAAVPQNAGSAPAAAPPPRSWLERMPRPDFGTARSSEAPDETARVDTEVTASPAAGLSRFSRFSLGSLKGSAAPPAPPVVAGSMHAPAEEDKTVEWEIPVERLEGEASADATEPVLPEPTQFEEPTFEGVREDLERSLDELLAQSEFRMTWPPATTQISEISVEETFSKSVPDPQSTNVAPSSHEPAFKEEDLSDTPDDTSSDASWPASLRDRRTIVGQYESKGTSYVMYSDGSIEARSDRGVLHFESMAELKAFMEGQA
ncbi:hypothetical protein CU048_15755 [Beijerinckiaceae bacterium]|nr:hypothetical protein CU048_15755 [Beijerinckiaceae bacterium]